MSAAICIALNRTMYTIWLSDADWVSDGQGGYELRPHQMVLASAYGDAIRVDEWDKEEDMPFYYSCTQQGLGGPTPEEKWKRKADRGVQIDDEKVSSSS